MHVVRRKIGGEESEEQLSHLSLLEPIARFHRRTTGVRGREALQPIAPAAKPSPGQIGNHLAKTGLGIEALVQSRHRMNHNGPASESLDLESNPAELLAVGIHCIELLVRQLHRQGQ